MSPRLRLLLAFLGIATVFGVRYTVLQVVSNTAQAVLADAGLFKDCSPIAVTGYGGCRLADGGFVYRSFVTKAGVCPFLPDGGRALVLPDTPGNCEIFRIDGVRSFDGGCGEADVCDAGAPFGTIRPIQHGCACRGYPADAGPCRVQLADGGTPLGPFGETYGPGYRFSQFAGPGCVRKSCGEVFGNSSWPLECPP